MSKKDRIMKFFGLLEKFRVEYNIPLSMGLCFIEDSEVDLAESSLIEGETILPKSYFKAGLKLPILPLFKNVIFSAARFESTVH